MEARPAPVKVLHIVGWGRSGTTLMDNVLGGHPGVVTAGEVTQLWSLGIVQGRRCGCGHPVLACPFWSAVFARAFDGAGPPDAARMIALQKGPLAVVRTPALVAAARAGSPTPAAARYADVLSRLYRAVADRTGCRVVVDASKRPPDAVLTAMAPGVEPYLLHMVRDPRACAWSWQRSMPDPSATGARMHRHGRLMNVGHWVSWNLLAERVARAYPPGRYRTVRYEDFMSTPRATVDAVLGMLGEPAGPGPFTGDDVVDLPANHTIAGNPGRFRTGTVAIRLDDEWRSAQRRVDRTVTTALALPWLHRYGYPWRVHRG